MTNRKIVGKQGALRIRKDVEENVEDDPSGDYDIVTGRSALHNRAGEHSGN